MLAYCVYYNILVFNSTHFSHFLRSKFFMMQSSTSVHGDCLQLLSFSLSSNQILLCNIRKVPSPGPSPRQRPGNWLLPLGSSRHGSHRLQLAAAVSGLMDRACLG